VLAPNFGDIPGGQGNWGCRLSDLQIAPIVDSLRHNAAVFGGNTTFTWNGVITTFTNGYDNPACGARRLTFQPFFYLWIEEQAGGAWTSSVINLYFTGNCAFNVNDVIWGATYDPADHDPAGSPPRYRSIVINDGGFSAGFGERASMSQSVNVLPHEMCHYLARFELLEFPLPNGSRHYDSGEHNHDFLLTLLQPDGPDLVTGLPISPHFVPGDEDDLSTELGRVFQRIHNGQWNTR
jgi:hypothetical protein